MQRDYKICRMRGLVEKKCYFSNFVNEKIITAKRKTKKRKTKQNKTKNTLVLLFEEQEDQHRHMQE